MEILCFIVIFLAFGFLGLFVHPLWSALPIMGLLLAFWVLYSRHP